jgi:hypothetical protein
VRKIEITEMRNNIERRDIKGEGYREGIIEKG